MGLKTKWRHPTLKGPPPKFCAVMCLRLLLFFLLLFFIEQQPFANCALTKRIRKGGGIRSIRGKGGFIRGDDVPCNEKQVGKEVPVDRITGVLSRNPNFSIVCKCVHDVSASKYIVRCEDYLCSLFDY